MSDVLNIDDIESIHVIVNENNMLEIFVRMNDQYEFDVFEAKEIDIKFSGNTGVKNLDLKFYVEEPSIGITEGRSI